MIRQRGSLRKLDTVDPRQPGVVDVLDLGQTADNGITAGCFCQIKDRIGENRVRKNRIQVRTVVFNHLHSGQTHAFKNVLKLTKSGAALALDQRK